ncbi:hypothetical protein MPF19_18700 [Polaribacter sp. Z014]|uniref:hypothetical protein n=1 Tax=Polaribacter sp. Z014 TaxID=2927126 RepID=UPI002020D620|nr:hypothetical protein [Polaribacter sp. Z014]MCL7765452.1 hypothetical protein [Polaribacter sp. Z014]
MKILTNILILLISNLTLAQIEKKNDTLEIWTLFSIGNFVNQNAEKIIEKEWPFKVKGIAGDSFVEGLIDSVEIHNNKIWNYLDTNGYSNSKKKFESDLLAEIIRIKKAVEISQSNKTVSELYTKLRKRKLQNYTELKKENNTKYEFTVFSFDLKNLERKQDFEFKFISDLKKEKTKIIE